VAKEIFMTMWLSNSMILAGETLIDKLDASEGEVVAAFWLLEGVEKTWELTIVSPLVESEGPRNYYKRINQINEAANPDEEVISLHDIRVSNTNNRIVNALKNSVLRNATLKNNRLGKNFIGGEYFEDMYLYRLDWDVFLKSKNLNEVAEPGLNWSA
jgi:hypothetical protein